MSSVNPDESGETNIKVKGEHCSKNEVFHYGILQ